MSRLAAAAASARANRAADFCTTCNNRRYRTRAGNEQAVAARCPACSAVCADCDGRGYTFVTDWTGALVASPCGCAELDRRIALFNAARLPRRYAEADLEAGTRDVNDSVRVARLACYKLTVGFKPGDPGIGLTGPVGCGKTHMMAGIVRALTLENGVPCRFVEFTHLLSDLRQGFEKGEGSADTIAEVVAAPVLVIDELGKGLTTQWQKDTLDELISRRYNSQVTTLFTSNFAADRALTSAARARDAFEAATLDERVGPRMASRLAEMCRIVAIDAPDYRRRDTAGG